MNFFGIYNLQQFVFVLLFFLVGRLAAQPIVEAKLLTVNDGLSQGMVYDILQSKNNSPRGLGGFIWIATNDGLNRYDGARYELFSPDPFNAFSISGSEVNCLFEDSRGLIWVSVPGQLEVFDPKRKCFFHILHEGKPVFSQDHPSIAETPDASIWLTDDQYIWNIKLPDGLLEEAFSKGMANVEIPCRRIALMPSNGNADPSMRVSKVFYSHKKKLLVGTNQGLFHFDTYTEKLVPEYLLQGFDLREIAEDKEMGILMVFRNTMDRKIWAWISPNGGIREFKDPSITIYPRTVFALDAAGYLWTFRNRSIQKWKLNAFFDQSRPELDIPTEASFLTNKYAYCTKIIFDRSGVGWAGTDGYGIIKFNEKPANFKTFLPNITQRIVVEAPDAGLHCLEFPGIKYASKAFDRTGANRDYYGGFHVHDNNSIGRLAVCFDRNGNGWSCSRQDSLLYRMDAVTKKLQSFPWKGFGLLCTRQQHLLSVSKNGLHKLDPQTHNSSFYPFEKALKRVSDYSHYLYEDKNGIIWIFGLEGLTKAVPDGAAYRFEHFTNVPTDRLSLSSNIVLSVVDDPLEPDRYLWIGTKGGGLNRLDKKTQQFKHYKTEQGLPNDVVYGVLAENPSASGGPIGRHIWLSTNKGLCRFDVRSEQSKNFTVADGLQDNEFNSSSYLKTRNGTMLFGGVKGLTLFHPDSLYFNPNIPQIHIVGLSVNNKKFEIIGKSGITLSHAQNLLTFDFAALEFTNPSQNQYRYQLVGVDKDWVSLGNKNSIQFANLAPGDYTLKVEGSNNDGIWSEQAAELRFTIRPPWWASWWAWLIYVGIIAASIWQYYQFLLRRRFSEQEQLRLQELDDFKSRFFTNITHEFRTPLTVILGMSEQLTNEEKDEPKRHKIGLIKRSGENLLRLVNQILDLAKLESKTLKINYIQSDVLAFVRYIAESLHSLANAQNLMLRVESDQTKIIMDYDPERLLQIVHNLLSNAIKFTPSGGKVVLNVTTDLAGFGKLPSLAPGNLPSLNIRVTDTGTGIPPEELPYIFERFFQAKNQEQASVSLSGRTGMGAGTTGIGLSLTRELVKAMGGEITVESTVGAGSTFWVKLPMTNNSVLGEKAVEITKTATAKRLPAALSTSTKPDRHHILLIEDNPDVVEYLNACLKDGYNLDFAYNGQAGIEKALENVPDLIVSDVMMPFKDGFEVVEALKHDERTSHIPIVLLTAKADVQSRLAGLRKGADAYLSKPFHQEELLVTVENLLELRRKLQLKYQQNILAPVFALPADEPVNAEDTFLQNVRAIIEANYAYEDFGLPQLCQKLGMSRSQLFRKMKALTDIAPSDLIRIHRLNKAKALLKNGDANVTEAAWGTGFKDPSYFSKLYQEEFGEMPSATRK